MAASPGVVSGNLGCKTFNLIAGTSCSSSLDGISPLECSGGSRCLYLVDMTCSNETSELQLAYCSEGEDLKGHQLL